MKLKLSLFTIAAVLLFAPLSHAQILRTECNSTIIDKAGVIRNPAIVTNAARTLINQGADVHVVTVDSVANYGGNLAAVETYLEQTCPSWTTNGQRKANLFVVMVAPTEHSKNMFLGSYYAGAFDIASTYSQLANPAFHNGNFQDGIAAALQGTTGPATAYRQRMFRAQQQPSAPAAGQPRPYVPAQQTQQTSDSGVSGLLIFLGVVLVLGGIGVVLYLIFRAKTSSETTTTYSNDDMPSPDRTASYPATPYRYAASAGASSAPPVTHTTIINNTPSNDGFVTGMVMGEMLSRPSRETVYVEQPAPTYVEPTPSYDLPAPSAAPDTTWEQPQQQDEPDTSFSTPDPEPDTNFGGDSGGSSDSSF